MALLKRHVSWRFLQKNASAVLLAADPVICSICIFILQSSILFTSSKVEFAVFSLTYSYVVMGQAILAGIFGGPIITLLSRRSDRDEKTTLGKALLRANVIAGVLLGLASIGLSYAFNLSLLLVVAAALVFVLLSFRDAMRGILICSGQASQSFLLALIFTFVSVVYAALSYWLHSRVDALNALIAIALGAGITMMPAIIVALLRRVSLVSNDRRELIKMATWSLPGSIIIWMQNSFYLTIIAKTIGMQAVGEISAARLIIMPILVVSASFLRIFQAHLTKSLMANGELFAAHVCRNAAFPILAVGLLFAMIVWLSAFWVPVRLIPDGHRHMLPLTAFWLTFCAASIARGIYSSLYQAMGRYRELFTINLLCLPLVLGGVSLLPNIVGLYGAIVPLTFGEICMMGVMWHRARRQRQT